MKTFLIITCAAFSTATASTDMIHFVLGTDHVAHRENEGSFGSRNGSLVYDNLTFPTEGGNTHLISFPRYGFQEVGDDLILASSEAGFLSDGSYAFINLSPVHSIQAIAVINRWYDDAGAQIAEWSDDFGIGGGLPPLNGAIIDTTGGYLRHFNVPLHGTLHWSLQFTAVEGISIDDLGFVVAGPHTLGSSSSLIHNYSTGQDIDLGNNGDSNLMFRAYSVTPAPSVAGLATVAAGIACSRRRRDTITLA